MARRRRLGLGQATGSVVGGYPVFVQVADPQFIAQAKATAAQNGIDPSTVDQLIASGADAVQIALAVTQAPFGPAQLQSQLDTTNQLTAAADVAQAAAITGGVVPIATTVPPPGTDAWTWLQSNWPWLALGAIGVWWLSREL